MSEQPTNLEELAAAHNNQLRNATSKIIKDLHDSIMADIPKNTIPEDVFVDYFLDYFANPGKEENDKLARWITVAGGPYNEVDIVDNFGNVVCTAPPAMLMLNMNYEELNKINFSEVAKTYINKRLITDAVGRNYLTSILSAVPSNIQANVKEHILKWSVLINRYRDKISGMDTPKDESVKKDEPKQSNIDVGILDI